MGARPRRANIKKSETGRKSRCGRKRSRAPEAPSFPSCPAKDRREAPLARHLFVEKSRFAGLFRASAALFVPSSRFRPYLPAVFPRTLPAHPAENAVELRKAPEAGSLRDARDALLRAEQERLHVPPAGGEKQSSGLFFSARLANPPSSTRLSLDALRVRTLFDLHGLCRSRRDCQSKRSP